MKRIILSLSLLSVVCSAYSQFNVTADGSASITTYNGEHAFSATHSIYGIKGTRKWYNTSTSNWGYGIYGKSDNHYTLYSVGVAGIATTDSGLQYNSGRAYGVLGEANLATNGHNYGIFGRLSGNEHGAAIYGTTGINDYGALLGNRYAGYFNGHTHVVGMLTVDYGFYSYSVSCENLFVQGSSVLPTPIVTPLSSKDEEVSLSERLANLSVVTSYPEATVATMELETPTNKTIQQQHSEKKHYTFDTSQLEEYFPELVYTNEDNEKLINYTEIIPILVQSIAELKAEIALLKGISSGVTTQNKSKERTTDLSNIAETTVISISQNKPNPWNLITDITVDIPKTIKQAILYIYDLNGNQIYSQEVRERGTHSITLSATDFTPGMYIYTLLADGKSTDAKRMIITE